MEEFKDRFRSALIRSGKTRAQVSRETGISQPLLHLYYNGECDPKQTNIALLSKSLGVSVDWLVTGIEPNSEALLVESYKRLPEEKQKDLLRYARYLEALEDKE